MDINNYCNFSKILEDPRVKSCHYSKGSRVKFDKDQFEFAFTQFIIDSNYVGEPPHVQVSIDNLNDNIDENFLRKDLAKLGRIRTLEIVRHPRTSQHLGLAKVQFEDVSVAKACVENFNGKHIMGRQLKVFLDTRFAIIDKLQAEKLNPRPQPPPTSRQRLEDRIATLLRQPNCVLSTMVGPQTAATQAAQAFNNMEENFDFPNNSYYHAQPYLTTPTREIDKPRLEFETPDHLKLTPTTNNPSNHHTHYPIQHQHPNHHPQHRNSTSDLHHDRLTHEHNDITHNNQSENCSEHHSDDDWKKSPEPFNIELTEKQIDEEVLPYCFDEFFKELTKNLESTIFKKLRESYGYQCLEKAQTAFKQKQDQLKLQRDQERIQHELQKQFETRFILSKNRSSASDRQNEAPRPRVNLIRQRIGAFNLMQDSKRRDDADLRRVNRSSAYVNEPGRRGSRGTSIESDFSDRGSSSSRSSRSTSSSSSASSRSSSPFDSSSSSYSSYSKSSLRSGSFSSPSNRSGQSSADRKPRSRKSGIEVISDSKSQTITRGSTNVMDYSLPEGKDRLDQRTEDENLAVSALIDMGVNKDSCPKIGSGTSDNYDNDISDFIVDDDKVKAKTTRKGGKSTAKKRKKASQVLGVASEYRAAKRFAADPKGTMRLDDEDLENAMLVDENFQEAVQDSRYVFQERSREEKDQMLDDLFGTMTEEDIRYLKEVHVSILGGNVPFGSDNANKAHLNLSKRMIENKAAEGHPKWWRGCSRCDVIEVSEKGKMQIEETNYEDLTKAPIKSNVIQTAATSSRRDLRGDQRRIAVLNPELDADILKLLTTNTLQMRAKNLRFSRSKIHKWGLFACEKISSGDAVIEYVGEKIRPSVADHREKIIYTDLPTHDGSSYFFRVDSDVIDATLKGNKARFINHSCNPNCIAKVIRHDNGSNSIVIYARQAIQEDEEITYDYKFPVEETDQKIRCNCKAPNCKKYLN